MRFLIEIFWFLVSWVIWILLALREVVSDDCGEDYQHICGFWVSVAGALSFVAVAIVEIPISGILIYAVGGLALEIHLRYESGGGVFMSELFQRN